MLWAQTASASIDGCHSADARFAWDSAIWADGDLEGSYSVSGRPLEWSVTGDTGALATAESGQASPLISTRMQGGTGTNQPALRVKTAFDNSAQSIEVTIAIGRPGEGVASLETTLFDVDAGLGFEDEVVVSAFLQSAPVAVRLSGPSQIQLAGNRAVGTEPVDSESAEGNLSISVAEPVDRLVVSYRNAIADGSTADESIYFHDLSFCQPEVAIDAEKRIIGARGADGYFLPGTDVVYEIEVENFGTGWVDDDSILLIDALPPDLIFLNGDADGAGPGQGAVQFVDNASGLSFDLSRDVAFSNASVKPARFDDCTYQPSAEYDSGVRFVCINPKGPLKGSADGRGFRVAFAAQIR